MSLSPRDCSAVILAGGRSRRMGRCKALLTLEGETIIARLAGQLSGFGELLVSANDPAVAAGLDCPTVPDRYPDAGPLAGLHAALSAAQKEFLFCVPCDLPRFTRRAAACILDAFPAGADALVCADSTGRVHPLCGVYARSALPVIQRQLEERSLRMRDLLQRLNCAYFPLSGRLPDSVLTNVNTPEAFALLRRAPGATCL